MVRPWLGFFAGGLLGWLVAASQQVVAATITKDTIDSEGQAITLIVIEGELRIGDEHEFANVAISADDAIVVMDSPGGSLVAGIEIGKAIRLKGFATVVPDGFSCASACALSWLGGRVRFMGSGARIGFHAAYVTDGATQLPASVGNALVGAYLSQLGLPVSAIAYITEAQPEQIRWLTFSDAEDIGIDVKPFSSPGTATADTAPTNSSRETGASVPYSQPGSWSALGDWIQIFSRSRKADAIQLAEEYGSHLGGTYVLLYDNGWYVVVTGPFPPGTADARRRSLIASGAIPNDSLVNHGARFVDLVWGEGATSDTLFGAYLFDLLKMPRYRSAWKRMFRGEASLPAWIDSLGENSSLVSSPSSEIEVGGIRYLLSNGCKPHDCFDNQLHVLYSATSDQAWAVLKQGLAPLRWFGNPNTPKRRALLGALSQ